MILVADESVDGPIVDRLRDDGHQVEYVAEANPGISDEDVLALCNRFDAPLITADKDFGELVFRLKRATTGVMLLRLAGNTPEEKAQVVAAEVDTHGPELHGAFTVVTRSTIRIRRMPA